MRIKLSAVFAAGVCSVVVVGQANDHLESVDPAARHCTLGEVSSALQAFLVGVHYPSDYFSNVKIAGLGGSPDCQYRLFLPEKPIFPESHWTFCEHDVFLGGVTYSIPYKTLGVSRETAIEDLQQVHSTVTFGSRDGLQEQRFLVRTQPRNFVHPSLGNSVYMQEAFITQEAPGTYSSTWTWFQWGAPFTPEVVYVEVVSHEEHLLRVQNGSWRIWSKVDP